MFNIKIILKTYLSSSKHFKLYNDKIKVFSDSCDLLYYSKL